MKMKLMAGIILGMGILAGVAHAAEQVIDVTFLNNSGVGTTTTEGTIALTTQIASDTAPPQNLVYTISDLDLDDTGGANDSIDIIFTVTTDGQNIFAKTSRAGWLSSGGVRINGNPAGNEFLTMTYTDTTIHADDPSVVAATFLGFTSVQMGGWSVGDTSVVNGVTYSGTSKNIDLMTNGNDDNLTHVTTAFIDGVSAQDFRPEKYDFQIKIGAPPNAFTDATTDGKWVTAGNWTQEVPSTSVSAEVNGNLTASLEGVAGTAKSIVVGSIANESGTVTNGTLTVLGGTSIGTASNATGVINLTDYAASSLAAGIAIATAEDASGSLIAGSGLVNGGDLSVGTGTGSTGLLDLGGTLNFAGETIIGGATDASGTVDAGLFTLSGTNANLTVASGDSSIGSLTGGAGSSVDSSGLTVASGSNSVGTLNIGTGNVTLSGNVNVATGQDSTANMTLGTIILASTNGIFVGTGVGSSHDLTATDFAITGPIGDFTMGDSTGNSIESLMSLHDSFGAIQADKPLTITAGNHQITELIKNAELSIVGAATFTNTSYTVANLAGVTTALDLADWTAGGAIMSGALTVGSGDNTTSSLTYTNGTLDIMGAVNVGNGTSSDATLILNSMTSIATNNSLSICNGASGSTGTVAISGSALVQSLRVGTTANSHATLTGDSISAYQYLIVGRGSNSYASVSANTFNRPVALGLQLGEGQDSYASVTAENGEVSAGGSNGVNIGPGIGSESIFALTNGTLTIAAKGKFNVATGSNSVATVYVGTIDVPGTNDVNIATGANAVATVTTRGGTITADNLNLGSGGVLALAGGNLVMTTNGMVNTTGGYIDTQDADSTFAWTGKVEADFVALWDAGTLRSNGESGLTGATFSGYYVVNGGVLSTTPISTISIEAVPGGVAISWIAIAGQSYDIEYKNNLVTDPLWMFEINVTGTAGAMSVTVPTTADERFYQVRAL